MADSPDTEQKQTPQAPQADENRAEAASDPAVQMEDWEIEHSAGQRKAHPGKGDHFVGNAAETLQAPITNEPADQTRSHGNRPKRPMQQRG